MASRPIFIPLAKGSLLVATKMVEFKWHPGMAYSQKQKSVLSLHEAARRELGLSKILEISTKSPNPVGVQFSAFSLRYTPAASGKAYFLESIYQSSKIFEQGGPYTDIRNMSPADAKRDERLRNSGRLIGFRSANVNWGLEPKTAFYDWLYINTIRAYQGHADAILNYEAFTDIEFNPQKSVNCQAYSAALYASLHLRGLIDQAMQSRESYLSTLTMFDDGQTQTHSENGSLF